MWSLRGRAVRVVLIAAAIFGAVFAPFWVPLIAILFLSMLFRAWEVPLIGLGMDLLWLPSIGFLDPFPMFTVGSIVIMFLFEPLRREFLV